ncbi:hypothetical protein F2Q70_00004017 [Brassica cretica]|uniref:Aspartic peptidase DDI1-type domain-containing protein n=1 Tax=Brassica cretica TaxID=69181 RepID=A0A8S9IWB7_BRACR|nr:hypothetical protein F2Q70_00004017 [Brassica cretica]
MPTATSIDTQKLISIDNLHRYRSTCPYHVPSADAEIDVARLNALKPKPKPSEQSPEHAMTPSVDGDDPMEEDRASTGRTLRRRNKKVARHLKRGANEKEKENFQKRVFRIPLHKPFEEAYYSHRLWMFFIESREKEEDIRRMFCQAREKMRRRITLKKKSNPGQFVIPCTVQGIEFPHALCNTGVSVNILPRVMADLLGLKVEPSQELFTFVDCSQKSSGGIVRDLEVQIGNALVPVDFHVLDIKLNWNSSLLLGRAFLSTVGADDLWQVVKEEKLQEGDFEVESLTSFSGSHWCRSTQNHRASIEINPPRSIDRSTIASIENAYGVNRVLQCREDSISRGVRSETPTSAQP